MKIAVLDDSVTIITLLKKYLSKYDTYYFVKVSDFLEDIQNNYYDLFIIDINMPEKNGFDVIEDIKNMPHLKDSKVVILSSELNEQNKQKAKALKIMGFIKKPFNDKIQDILDLIIQKISK